MAFLNEIVVNERNSLEAICYSPLLTFSNRHCAQIFCLVVVSSKLTWLSDWTQMLFSLIALCILVWDQSYKNISMHNSIGNFLFIHIANFSVLKPNLCTVETSSTFRIKQRNKTKGLKAILLQWLCAHKRFS